jgi:hypothetical protein
LGAGIGGRLLMDQPVILSGKFAEPLWLLLIV